MFRIWDAHVHMFPERLFAAIWRWFDGFGWSMPFRGISLENGIAHLKAIGVERAFLLVYAHCPDISYSVNAWVKEVCQNHSFFIPFGCVHPLDKNLDELLSIYLDEWNFPGLKVQLSVMGMAADDPVFYPIYEALMERNKILVAHAGTAPLPGDNLGFQHFLPVLKRYPDLKVIIPHLGLYDLEEFLSLLGEYKNLYLDTSWAFGGLICFDHEKRTFYLDTSWAKGNPSLDYKWEKLLNSIYRYPERFLYGSDFPIVLRDPGDGIDVLLKLGLREEYYERIFFKNAVELVRLEN